MTTRSRYTASITDKPWWLAGGIPASACVAAYQAKGASSYAASKVNLANPGLHNAGDGPAYPVWDVINGWSFTKASSQYITTDIVPGIAYTTLIKISNRAVTAAMSYFGAFKTFVADEYTIYMPSGNDLSFLNGSGKVENYNITGINAGVFGINGSRAIINGVQVGTTMYVGGTNTGVCYIGANYDSGVAKNYFNGYVQAFCMYSLSLPIYQVTALTNAMNAL